MYIGWEYAISNIPTLPREAREVSKNMKDVISTFCSVASELSLSGYGMKYPQKPQWQSTGIVHAQPDNKSVVAPSEDAQIIAPNNLDNRTVIAPVKPDNNLKNS